MTVIASEQRAEEIGEQRTGGARGEAFTVFQYEQRFTRLTLFGIELADGEIIKHDPRAAVSAHSER